MKIESIVEKADHAITAMLKTITIALFILLTIILTVNIISRFIPIVSLHWLDEIVELLFAAMVFYGAAAVWMIKGHFSAGNWIEKRIKNIHAKNLYKMFLEFCSLIFVVIFFRYSLDLTLRAGESTTVFQIPKAVLYSCMPISAAIMAVYSIARIITLATGKSESGEKVS
jgi:TRAP-type C4-dicarboxylate transport system permease small subunit